MDGALDLGTPVFWIVALVAVICVVPIVHGRARVIVLAIIDLGFACALAGLAGTPVVIGMIAVLYLVGIPISRSTPNGMRVLALAALVLVAVFVAHKLPQIELPGGTRGALTAIGFSYVALRAVELVRAVAEQRHPPPDVCSLISYLVPFHMLAAGPILAYDEARAQPEVPPPLTVATTLVAFDRIASGLFKKFVIAQAIDAVALTGFAADSPYLLLEIQLFYVWVYLDFSAYSDIAIGIGMLLGRATPENFANPLAARNIIEFWERWHISLSQFIRRNLFIPIQLAVGRRGAHPLAAACIAISISFVACGLWHGLSWRFLAWGGIHAAGLVVTYVYRHLLLARLGRRGVKSYQSRKLFHVIAIVLTFEFVAGSLAFAFHGGIG